MAEALAPRKGLKSSVGAPPPIYDSAHELFFRYVEMNFYSCMDNGARRQSHVYPNPPIQVPADDGDDDTERLRKLIDDIKSGKVKTTYYTLDEYMRHLDKIWGG